MDTTSRPTASPRSSISSRARSKGITQPQILRVLRRFEAVEGWSRPSAKRLAEFRHHNGCTIRATRWRGITPPASPFHILSQAEFSTVPKFRLVAAMLLRGAGGFAYLCKRRHNSNRLRLISPSHSVFNPSATGGPAPAMLQPANRPPKGSGTAGLHDFCRPQHERAGEFG